MKELHKKEALEKRKEKWDRLGFLDGVTNPKENIASLYESEAGQLVRNAILKEEFEDRIDGLEKLGHLDN